MKNVALLVPPLRYDLRLYILLRSSVSATINHQVAAEAQAAREYLATWETNLKAAAWFEIKSELDMKLRF